MDENRMSLRQNTKLRFHWRGRALRTDRTQDDDGVQQRNPENGGSKCEAADNRQPLASTNNKPQRPPTTHCFRVTITESSTIRARKSRDGTVDCGKVKCDPKNSSLIGNPE